MDLVNDHVFAKFSPSKFYIKINNCNYVLAIVLLYYRHVNFKYIVCVCENRCGSVNNCPTQMALHPPLKPQKAIAIILKVKDGASRARGL